MSIKQYYSKPFKLKAKKSKNSPFQQIRCTTVLNKFIFSSNMLVNKKLKSAYKIIGYSKEPMV